MVKPGMKMAIAAIILAVAAAVLFFALRGPAPAPAGPSLGEQLLEKIQNPVKGELPEANPFKESEINPFQDVYKNPFE